MALGVVTLRPNSTSQLGSWTVTGAANAHTALSDNTDSSYIQVIPRCRLDPAVLRVGFPTPTIPAGAKVYSVTLRRRVATVVAGSPQPVCLHWFRSIYGVVSVAGQIIAPQKYFFQSPCPTSPTTSAFVEENLGTFTTGPGGVAWDPATNLVGLTYDAGRGDDFAGNLKISEVYVDVTYQQLSTVTVTAPTGTVATTRPTVTWTYASPDSQPQQAYEVVIYTAAQVGGVGFVPFVNPPIQRSGLVLGEDQQWTLTNDLPDGGYCVDMATEIMTTAGWKRFEDLSEGGVTALTLNHETGLSEWQPITGLNYFPPQEREMLRLEGRGHSSLTTRDHRWPVVNRGRRRWKTSDKLAMADALTIAAPCASLPTEPKYQDALVELVAWTWTEGCLLWGNPTGNPAGLDIYQSHSVNAQHCAAIRRALTDLYGPAFKGDMRSLKPVKPELDRENQRRSVRGPQPAWREIDRGGGRTAFRLNSAAAAPIRAEMDSEKRVSCDFITALTQAQLKLFVDRSIDADGHRGTHGTVFIQKDEESVRRLEMAAALLGMATNTIRRTSDGCHQVIFKKATRIRPIESARSASSFTGTWVKHDGAVWCPTLPNGSWLARRRGSVFFTGNSAYVRATSAWGGPGTFRTAIASTSWTRAVAAGGGSQPPGAQPPNATLSSAVFDTTNNRVALTMVPSSSSPVTVAFTVEASRDAGVTWTAIPSLTLIPANGMTPVVAYDYVAPINVTSQYRVMAYSTSPLVGAAAYSGVLSVTTSGTNWWLKCPANPLLNTVLPVAAPQSGGGSDGGLKIKLRRMQGTFELLSGSGTTVLPIIVSGPTYGEQGELDLIFVTTNPANTLYANYLALDQSGDVLFLQKPNGEQLFVVLGPGAAGQDTEGRYDAVPGSPGNILWRRIKTSFTQVAAPSYY